jgi:hypothetical protein
MQQLKYRGGTYGPIGPTSVQVNGFGDVNAF